MHQGRATRQGRETATTTLEAVGIAVGAALLLGGIGSGFAAHGGTLGRGVGDRVSAIVAQVPGVGPTRRWRTAHELRTGGGSDPVRVPRDELRMRPVVDPVAWREWRWRRAGERAGVRGTVDAQGCIGCGSLEWSWELLRGGQVRSDGSRSAGLGAAIEGSMRLAIASVQVAVGAERDLGGAGSAFTNARLRGAVGVEADVAARGLLTRGGIDVGVDAGARAGAVARAQVRSGVDLLGISIRQSAAAEGWAGAGARGAVGVRTSDGRIEWRTGWGGALGLGGAAEWSGSIDVAGMSPAHRRLARASIAAALGPLGLPVLLRPGE